MDRAARAAGTIYRVAAGTESFDLGTNKQAIRSTDDDTDINDNNDSTSRKSSSGYNYNGVIKIPPNYFYDCFVFFFFFFFFYFLYILYLQLHTLYLLPFHYIPLSITYMNLFPFRAFYLFLVFFIIFFFMFHINQI